jgi:two-component system chemotaxis sensor kinase CheA
MVARLEEFPLSSIEHSGGQQVVRYRGQILPLVHVADYLPNNGEHQAPVQDPLPVVVYTEQGRSIGLVVGRINDIVSETITVKRHSFGNGILGSVVIQGAVTDLLDVQAVIRAADPTFYPAKLSPSIAA